MSVRKSGSMFDKVCNYINSLPIGTVYTCKELHQAIRVNSSRLGYIHCHLMDRSESGNHVNRGANVVKRISRGKYEVLAHIPDFVTYNMLEANYGYQKYEGVYPNGTWVLRGKPWKAGQPNPNSETIAETTTTGKRKSGSLFDQICTFINSKPIGTEFHNDELYNATVETTSFWKERVADKRYITRWYRYMLMRANVVQKLGKCKWKVLAHIPEDVDSNIVNGWKHGWNNIWKSTVTVEIPVTENNVNNVIERIDSLMEVEDETNNASSDVKCKFIYNLNLNKEHIKKIKVRDAVQPRSNEYYNLHAAIAALAILSNCDIDQMADLMLEELEEIKLSVPATEHSIEVLNEPKEEVKTEVHHIISNNEIKEEQIMLEDLTKKITLEIIVNPHHITIEDIRGKEAYLYEDGLIGKGIIKSFQLKCGDGTSPMYHDIEVATKWSDGTTGTKWIDDAKLLITKEEAFKKLEDNLNSL